MTGGKGWRRWIGPLLAGWLLLLAAGRAWAQPAGPEMTVSTAWEGLVRKPGWVELQITLENESGEWDGEVVVEDRRWTTTYHLPVQLPAHAHKVYRLPVFVGSGDSAEVALLDAQGEEVERHSLTLRALPFDTRICIAADPLTTMNLADCDESLLIQQPEMMPEMASAWEAIDLLVMRDFPTAEMSEAQREALRAWVAAGGHLVLLEGPAMDAMLEGLPPSLRPSCESPTPVQRPDGSTLTVCRRTVGLGEVDRPRQTDPAALEALWAEDRVPATAFPFPPLVEGVNATLSAFFPTPNTLFRTPRSALPVSYALPLFALVYFLLLIPLPYLITRRLRRPMLTWLLIPALALSASLCLFLWLSGFATDSFPITHEMTFAFVPDADEPARLISFGATLAPRTRHLVWEVPGQARPGHGYFGQGNGPWMEEGEPYAMAIRPVAEGARVETEAPRGILTWGWEGLTKAPALTMEGRFADGRYDLHVESESPMRLQALVLYDEYLLPLHGEVVDGALDAGRPFTEVQTLPYYSYDSPLVPCAHALLENTMLYGYGMSSPTGVRHEAPHCYLIADRPEGMGREPSVEIDGKLAHESCYIYLVPCPHSEEGVLLPVLPNNIQVVEGDGWIAPDPSPATFFSQGAEETVWSFHVPAFFPGGELQRIVLKLEPAEDMVPSAASTPMPASAWDQIDRVAVWDWQEHQWVELEKPTGGASLEITHAAPYLDKDGEIRIRLEGTPLPAMHVTLAVQFGGE